MVLVFGQFNNLTTESLILQVGDLKMIWEDSCNPQILMAARKRHIDEIIGNIIL